MLQAPTRFTSDSTKVALISFQVKGLRVASYRIDLVGVTKDQFNPNQEKSYQQSIDPIDLVPVNRNDEYQKF